MGISMFLQLPFPLPLLPLIFPFFFPFLYIPILMSISTVLCRMAYCQHQNNPIPTDHQSLAIQLDFKP